MHLSLTSADACHARTQVRRAFPEFAQMSQRGGYEQQDSDEFLLRLLTLLKTSVTHTPASIADDDMLTKGNVGKPNAPQASDTAWQSGTVVCGPTCSAFCMY